jgi:hypothetical protein
MLTIQGVVTPGKAEFFKGLQFTPKGQPFTELRINLGDSDRPRWHGVTVYGAEAQLTALLDSLKKPEGGHTSLLVRAPAQPRTFTASIRNAEGEVTGQKELLSFSTNFNSLQVWRNDIRSWVDYANQPLF